MTIDELERRLRLPAPDEPAVLPQSQEIDGPDAEFRATCCSELCV